MSKIAIMETIGGAFAYVWAGRRDLLMLAFLPVLLLALLSALHYAFVPAEPPVVENEEGELVPVTFEPVTALLVAVVAVLYVMFAVAWHRRFLVPGETPTVGAALRWGRRQTRFLLRLIGLIVIASLVGTAGMVLIVLPLIEITKIAGGGLQALAVLAVMLAALVVYSRLQPVLPAAAVDEPLGFRAAWRLTRGYSAHMVLIWFPAALAMSLVSVSVTVTYTSLALAIGLAPSITAAFLGGLIGQALNYVGIAVTITALSIAYRDLTATGPVGGST